ncbi:hypothetical protein C5S53_14330 [Methanophagales archaeon]|nr:hypothetical protein C5S53_14330 [Methanophagales archaeon]
MPKMDLGLRKDIIISLVIAGAVGIVLALSQYMSKGATTDFWESDFWIAIPSVIFSIFFSFFAVEYVFSMQRQKNERDAFLKQVEEKIEMRMGNILEHAALYTDNKKFEDAIGLLHTASDKRMWIIAKFLSKKLNNDFSALKIEIDGASYSEFSGSLYMESKESVYLTSPFTPREWIGQLNVSDENLKGIGKGKHIAVSIPSHLNALKHSLASTKRRLFILSPKEWEELHNKDMLNYLIKFNELNKEIDTYFVQKEELERKKRFKIDTDTFDYAFFDEKLLLRWEKPKQSDEKTPLYLETEIDENNMRILGLFNFGEYESFYEKGDIIANELKQKSQ